MPEKNKIPANAFIQDFGKFKMVLDKDDKDVSRQIKDFGWYKDELTTTKVVEKHLKSGMTFVDLGANIGFYTILARSLVGPKGKIYAFEPSPHNADFVRASIKENSFTNVVVEEAAVSDFAGRTAFYLAPEFISEHSLYKCSPEYSSKNKIDVKVTTLD